MEKIYITVREAAIIMSESRVRAYELVKTEWAGFTVNLGERRTRIHLPSLKHWANEKLK